MLSHQMPQIISLHVGQGGIQLGSTCWQLFCLEHGFTPQGFKPILNQLPSSSYFAETLQAKHVPRALFFDLGSEATNSLLTSPFRQLYSRQNIVGGKDDAGSNFARGYSQLGKHAVDCFMDAIRKEVDKCENLQGFLVFSSLGGGTGGGLASLLLEKLSNEYQKSKKMSFSIYPSAAVSTSCVQPYNYALSAYFRRDHQNVAVVLDNQAIHDICKLNLGIERPTYSSMNRVIAQAVSGITAASRFDGCLNPSLSQFETHLVPHPRFHYMLASMAPINRREAGFYEKSSLKQLTNQVFEPASQLAKCDPRTGKFLACSIAYRGDIIPKDVGFGISDVKTKRTVQFVDWCSTGFRVGITYQPNCAFPDAEMAEESRSLSMLANSTAVSPVFERLDYKFGAMLRKKAFLHWFTRSGLEESLFAEVREELASLQRDYREAAQESSPDETAEQG